MTEVHQYALQQYTIYRKRRHRYSYSNLNIFSTSSKTSLLIHGKLNLWSSYLTSFALIQVRSDLGVHMSWFWGISMCDLEKMNVASVKQVWTDGRRKGCWITPCHIARRMHLAARENVKGGRKTLRFSQWSLCSKFFHGRNYHIH